MPDHRTTRHGPQSQGKGGAREHARLNEKLWGPLQGKLEGDLEGDLHAKDTQQQSEVVIGGVRAEEVSSAIDSGAPDAPPGDTTVVQAPLIDALAAAELSFQGLITSTPGTGVLTPLTFQRERQADTRPEHNPEIRDRPRPPPGGQPPPTPPKKPPPPPTIAGTKLPVALPPAAPPVAEPKPPDPPEDPAPPDEREE